MSNIAGDMSKAQEAAAAEARWGLLHLRPWLDDNTIWIDLTTRVGLTIHAHTCIYTYVIMYVGSWRPSGSARRTWPTSCRHVLLVSCRSVCTCMCICGCDFWAPVVGRRLYLCVYVALFSSSCHVGRRVYPPVHVVWRVFQEPLRPTPDSKPPI